MLESLLPQTISIKVAKNYKGLVAMVRKRLRLPSGKIMYFVVVPEDDWERLYLSAFISIEAKQPTCKVRSRKIYDKEDHQPLFKDIESLRIW